MTGVDILNDIVEIIVGGISSVATGIGNGISTLVTSLFFVTEGETTTLSMFAIVLCVFAGIGLALGLCYLVFNWLRSFGN